MAVFLMYVASIFGKTFSLDIGENFHYTQQKAGVAKLEDAPGSGSGEGNLVGVQIPASAPIGIGVS